MVSSVLKRPVTDPVVNEPTCKYQLPCAHNLVSSTQTIEYSFEASQFGRNIFNVRLFLNLVCVSHPPRRARLSPSIFAVIPVYLYQPLCLRLQTELMLARTLQ